jgi:hypothetical protein
VNACKSEIVPLDISAVIKKRAEGYGPPLPSSEPAHTPPQHQKAGGHVPRVRIKVKEGGDKGAFFRIVIFA